MQMEPYLKQCAVLNDEIEYIEVIDRRYHINSVRADFFLPYTAENLRSMMLLSDVFPFGDPLCNTKRSEMRWAKAHYDPTVEMTVSDMGDHLMLSMHCAWLDDACALDGESADGQIYLESDLFNQGFRPAINVGISVSRVGGSAQIKSMKKVAGTLKIDMAQYRELEAFSKFSSDMDAVTAMTLDRGRKNNQLLIQPQYSPMPVGEQIAILYCGTRGLMADVPVTEVRRCQDLFLEKMRSSQQEVLEKLGSGVIDDDTSKVIEAVMADIAGQFK